MSTPQAISKNQAISILWSKGILTFKLDAVQKELCAAYENSKGKITVWSCSRRLGKSYALCCLAIQMCIKNPGTRVKYIAPTQKHVKNIIRPLFTEILKDCPTPLRPEYRTADNIYRFPNGAEIQLAGTDSGHAEGLRGGNSHLCIVDEAGFCDDLKYIVQSILIPTTTTTNGKIILSSTPPMSPDHDFEEYRKEAEFKGNYVKKTIYDGLGSRITQEIIDGLIEEYGSESNPDFRREYLCEAVTSDEFGVVPEFNSELEKELVKEVPRPPYADNYVAGDIGFKDLTVFLFGYYDFKKACLVVEDEVVMNCQKDFNTKILAEQIKAKETKLFENPVTKDIQAPYMRVCDNNLILINDLQQLHNITFVPTEKDNAEAALNNMRVMLKERRIIIHPRCVTLIRHLRNAIWKKGRKEFARSPDMGHYDAVDALKYMVRNIVYSHNPYPANFGRTNEQDWFDNTKKQLTPVEKQIKSWFEPRKSLTLRRKR